MNRYKSSLEQEADKLLGDILKDKRKNKSSLTEYPILSDTQLSRRRSNEIPFSDLTIRQRIECGLDIEVLE